MLREQQTSGPLLRGEEGNADPEMMCFILVGDSGVYNISQALYVPLMSETTASKIIDSLPNKFRLGEAMAKISSHRDCKFVVFTGDAVYPSGLSADESQIGRLDQVMNDYPDSLLQKQWIVTLGNHDCQGDLSAYYSYGKYRNPTWLLKNEPGYYTKMYRHTAQGRTFRLKLIVLNTCSLVCPLSGEEIDSRCSELPDENRREKSVVDIQWAWLSGELAKKDADKIIVVGHWPIFSIRGNGPTEILLRKLRPLLLQNPDVIAYVCGHDHSMQHYVERGNLNYLVSGAGGAALHPHLKKSAYNITNIKIPDLKFVKDDFGFMLVTIAMSGNMRVEPFGEYGQPL